MSQKSGPAKLSSEQIVKTFADMVNDDDCDVELARERLWALDSVLVSRATGGRSCSLLSLHSACEEPRRFARCRVRSASCRDDFRIMIEAGDD